MKKPIQISIPAPCHENWDAMTPADKGRFCASCQKTVFDFTNSSDREIATVLKKIDNACGRFRNNQLNRNLIIPKEKSSLWIAASAAIVSFLTIGNQSISAQTPVNIEQTDLKTDDIIGDTIVMTMSNRIIKGIVKDSTGLVIPGVNVIIKGLKQGIQTDLNGKFSIKANEGQIIEISFIGMLTKEITITSSKTYEVVLLDDIEFYNSENISFDTYGNVIVRKTFFGRIFHSIGNIFR